MIALLFQMQMMEDLGKKQIRSLKLKKLEKKTKNGIII